jgi:hypothetical protein
MKTRIGYVSNSSSSSFIIAYNPQFPICETCGSSLKTLMDVLKGYDGCNETEITFDVVNILEEYETDIQYNIDHGWEQDNEDSNKIVEDIKKVAKDQPGYEFMELKIDYNDNFIRDIVQANINDGNFIEVANED